MNKLRVDNEIDTLIPLKPISINWLLGFIEGSRL